MNRNNQTLAFGVGIGTYASNQTLLEVWFPIVLYQPSAELTAYIQQLLQPSLAQPVCKPDNAQLQQLAARFKAEGLPEDAAIAKQLTQSKQPIIAVLLAEDGPLVDAASAYLKLHLLSLRHAQPNELNLDGIFSVLPNVVWTSEGAVLPEELPARRLQARLVGRQLTVDSIDKFPRMADYVIPSGVRIADARRVRLGAYLSEGTTIMHEGLINFNAGTLGTAMVEGRISQGVTLGEGSDLGGSSSTMGTLSGGGKTNVSIGSHCLLGANAGTGIPLGDHCTIEAGLYITAGTIVTVIDDSKQVVRTVKARKLAGQANMLFIRNSKTGRVECRPNGALSNLNEDLHSHN